MALSSSLVLLHLLSANLYLSSQAPSCRFRAGAVAVAVPPAEPELLRRKLSRSFSSSNITFEVYLLDDLTGYLRLLAFEVGTPPQDIIGIADTGSDLIWVNCRPCKQCYKQLPPLFEPKKSTTYQNLACNSSACTSLQESSCTESYCKYALYYGDKSTTAGNVAIETFTFPTTSEERSGIFPAISFGCSQKSKGTYGKDASGIVGLGGGELSLISQLGPIIDYKFSYCMAGRMSVDKMRFGRDAVVSGANVATIAMVLGRSASYYTVLLEGITVGDKEVPMINSLEIVIDTGSTFTVLEGRVMDPLINLIVDKVDLPRVEDPHNHSELCFSYKGRLALPTIVLHFGRASMPLSLFNAFQVLREEGIVCLAMRRPDNTPSILGNFAQVNFHFGYDLVEGTISFAKTDCSTL